MKLLLDVHHSPAVAVALVAAGLDVVAAATDAALNRLSDDELLRVATRSGRTIVTENARDFDRIVRAWAATGEHHGGVIFTSPRRFPRATRSYPRSLIAALTAFLASPPPADRDWVHWLP